MSTKSSGSGTLSDRASGLHQLSHGQRALWFLNRLAPDSAAYNIPVAIRISSEFDPAILRAALQKLVDRHASLRTTFDSLSGAPVQLVHQQADLPFDIVDASSWAEARLKDRLIEEAMRPFDLQRGPVIRASLFRKSLQESFLLLVVHHIVADFWSLALMMQELGIFYEAEKTHKPADIAPLNSEFADYVRLEAETLSCEEGDRLWKYWSAQLDGELPSLDLPTDRPRPITQSFQGASETFRIDSVTTGGLKTVGRSRGANLYQTLMAAFQTLLYRYTGQKDILVGAPAAGRKSSRFSGVVGYFVNPVVVRGDLSGNPPFAEFLTRTRSAMLSAFENQTYPFPLLVEKLQPVRDAGRSPIFQAMFVLQKTPRMKKEGLAAFALGETGAIVKVSDLCMESIALEQRTSQFDLTLMVAELDGELKASLQYNSEIFDRETILRMASHFQTLLAAIISDPQQTVSDLPLLTQPEMDELASWNHTYGVDAHQPCIHRFFQAQARRTPDDTAVIFKQQRLTYSQLDKLSNQLAHRLVKIGIGPEATIAVCLDRSARMIVALLAVMKAGGAYVPLDPAYPADRIRYMLDDSGARLVLTERHHGHLFAEAEAALICLDSEWPNIESEPKGDVERDVSADNLAYIIYTSGSTGKPKGVAIEHRSVGVLIKWAESVFDLEQLKGVLASTSICFDLSVFEMFVPLSLGGTVIVADNALRLAESEERDEVSLINTVPSAMAELVRMKGVPAGVKTVNLAGEALKRSLVEAVYEQAGVEKVYNLYGPSEDTTYSTCEMVRRGEQRAPTIGRPIANTEVYVLDERNRAVPVGVAGEIYIGGDGLARGYKGRAGQTAERWVPHGYSRKEGARLYRTGDVGRYLRDGRIEYLGRKDHQVKVRGYRIELGEVEAALIEEGGVSEAVVVAGEGEGGEGKLYGYVVRGEGGSSVEEVKERIRKRLPEYMVPAAIVELDQMPLTANGKINRKALPIPRLLSVESRMAASTPTEQTLAEIWQGVLGIPAIGVNESFFEIGGHSLLAARVITQARDVFGVELPISKIFEAPTIHNLAQYIEQASADNEKALAQPIRRLQRKGSLVTSFAQQRLWFLNQLDPDSAVYNMAGASRLKGTLDTKALERSINEVVSRHEALRTTFVEEEGEPRQVIHSQMKVVLVREDLSQLEEELRQVRLTKRMRELASAPFDLSRGPLLRAWLMKVDEREQVLVICMHHIISDGWSTEVMVRELGAFYEAAVTGKQAELPELEVQYADYAQWQRDHLHGEVLERQLVYWKNQLAGASVLQLPTDRHRPPIQSYRGSTHPFLIPSHLADSLRSSSLANAVTLFMTLLSAFKVLLHRYSAQLDIIVGTPVAGRNRIELESLIGLFVNTLVLRTDFSDDPTFRQALGRLREASLESYAHDDLPFERLVEELQTERDLSRNPLFQVMFLFQHESGQQFDMSGVKAGLIPWHTGTAKFDLTLAIQDDGEQLRAEIEYNTDLYDGVTIQRMAGHFQKALAQLAEDADTKVSGIDLLSDSERFELIDQWNLTQVDYKSEQLLHKAFEAQVSRTPDKVAVIFDRERLTYRELDERANQLAHHLKQSGVGPDVFVGICAERSVEMVIGLLGILKAGGAYVPLDPEYPKERLAFIIEDAGLGLLLTQEHVTDCLPVCEAKRLRLDADWGEVSVQPTDPCVNEVKPDNLAYAIYTSGSTGRPKGVMISHRGISNRLLWMQDEYGLSETESVLQKTSFGFDVSVWEFFWPLMVGARLVMARPGGHKDPVYLVKEITRQGITTLHFVPAMLQAFVDEPSSRLCESLKRVICSGEALSYELQEKFYSRLDAELHNLYGPTEASVDVTYFQCEKEAARRAVPIGRPIANTQIYILDAGKQAVPVGVAGELYIGGVGLGRGYVKRPDLTGERFVPNPYERATGSRLYATGDLARYQADGSIEYIGRLDHQVKIRGFRIELGEIEAVLAWHPQVRECLVTAHKDVSGETRLVAYMVGEGEGFPSASELREYVGEKLPAYMMPSAFVRVEEMPVTANGKVDRKALPVPEFGPSEPAFAPADEVQREVAEVFKQVLGLDHISLTDSFFELGGHSLLATQALSRIRRVFEVELGLRSLFEQPTAEGAARQVRALLEQSRGAGGELERKPIGKASREGAKRLSYAQARMWFLDQLEPGSAYYNVPAAVKLTGELDEEVLERSINEVVSRHEALRTTFVEEGGEPRQVIHDEMKVELGREDISQFEQAEREAELERRMREEASRPFDLSRGPLLRARLMKVDEQEQVLVISLHHIITDGWSTGLMVREVSAFYEAILTGKSVELPELEVQYADYAEWQREYLQGEVLERQLQYWKQKLEGIRALELPADRARPAVTSHRGAQHRVEISREVADGLRQISKSEGATLYQMMLAAFKVLLMRYSNQGDIAVGTAVANRSRAEVEGLIGLMVNTVVVRTEVRGEESYRQVLSRVKEGMLDGLANQEVPFERIVEEVEVERDMSRSPLFQVMFVLQHAPLKDFHLEGLTLTRYEIDNATSKFDLTLLLEDNGEGLTGMIEYNTDLFDRATIERMAGHFKILVEAVTSDPSARISDIQLLSGAEQHRLLVDWNSTEEIFPEVQGIHHLFEAQAKRTPNAVAIDFDQEQLTYDQLNRRANKIAHYLRKRGAGPDVPIAISLERSMDMIVGTLGILKSGSAYVPLDPTYPKDRLSFMLEDAKVPVLLSQSDLAGALPAGDAETVCLDTDWHKIELEESTDITTALVPDNLGYIIYTSGSTGRPKAIGLPHQALINLIRWHEAKLCNKTRTLQFASLSFDASFHEMFAAWATGGTLYVLSESERKDVLALARYFSDNRLEKVILPVVVLQQLAETYHNEPRLFASLKEIITTGEQLQITAPIIKLLEQLNDCSMGNHYGPSETHVVTAYTFDTPPRTWPSHPPIGTPISNTSIYIADQFLNPVPVGVWGELYIGGLMLARGYINRPDLTAEKFVANPFSPTPGRRMYRTGDLARFLPDGQVEFLGRLDHQVKIRGFRVELAEIESVLAHHPAVKEVVVIASAEGADKRLVAYVVTGGQATGRQLKDYLRQKLPDYMLPAAIVELGEMPLTANGKVNRKALPAADYGQQERAFGQADEVQREVAEIFKQVLGLEEISLTESFFEVGGHSLLATQAVSRIRRVFEVEMELRRLFEEATVAAVSREVRRLLEARLGAGAEIERKPIERRSREGGERLSYAQARMWFLDQLEPGSASYNIAAGVRLKGELDEEALERSINEVVKRHEALRTTFVEEEGEPRQVIHSKMKVVLVREDLSQLEEELRQVRLTKRMRELASTPFELSRGPLLRAWLMKVDEREQVLVICMHHIISDGWSIGVMVREVSAFYEAAVRGREANLPALEVQYADYAQWQREHLQGEVLERQLAYWKQKLEGVAVLELPTDRARPAVTSHRGAQHRVEISREVADGLRQISRRESATLYQVMLAAFKVLLMRYSNQTDIAVGTAVANRSRAEVEGLIGLMVNTVVVRTEVRGEESYRELLSRVKEGMLDGLANQEVPFERIVEEVEVERDMSRSPLFQVMFVLQNTPESKLRMEGVEIEVEEVYTGTTKFDITVSIQEIEDGMLGTIEYNSDLYRPETIKRMAGHFNNILESLIDDTNQRVGEIPMMSQPELQQVLVGWNETRSNYPEHACVQELFEQQVARTPDAVAVVYEGQQLSYKDLNRAANRLARRLVENGVTVESRVAILTERSLGMVVGLLAILKSGGAYVPLDHSYPMERLEIMVKESQAQTTLVQAGLEDKLPDQIRSRIDLPEEFWSLDEDDENLKRPVSADNLAYIMFTSGSTGQPKAVGIPHRGIVRLVKGTNYAELSSEDTFLQFASISFDASTFEIWGALLNGGRLAILSAGRHSLEELADAIEHHKVTTLWLTAGMFHQMAEGAIERLSGLRQLLAGGDVLSTPHVKQAVTRLKGTSLINGYGPTENTTFTCCYKITDPDQVQETVPIGTPIANTEVFIVDSRLQPTPVGVWGELYIGGDGLARGYLNSDDLTAEKFVANPFSPTPGQRMYRTGDLARFLPDGQVEFLGRLDHQVKIRGFRVELAEIESVLARHPAVKEVVVIASAEGTDKRLVAYVVTGGQASGRQLKDYLRQKLPDYMLPAAIVELGEMPLTANGKVNRKALPAADYGQQERAFGQADEVQREVAEIFKQVLGLEEISLTESFFEVGGHSLLATQAVSRIRRVFEVEMELRRLFEEATVAGVSREVRRLLEARLGAGAEIERKPIERRSREGGERLSYAQARMWFLDQLEPGSASYNIAAGVRLKGELDEEALERSINEVVSRHEALRTTFVEEGGEPRQVIHSKMKVVLVREDLSQLEEELRQVRLTKRMRELASTPFELSRGPLLRAWLMKVDEQEQVLVICMHHIISDGWSIGVMVREVSAFYEAAVRGREANLPALEVQYADYAQWQREHLQGEVLERQLAYWKQKLEGVAVLELPTDRARPAVTSHRGAQHRVEISREVADGLRQISRSEGATLYQVMMAAFKVLLMRYSNQTDIAVGTAVANRSRAEVEGLIGLMVNTVVVRTEVRGEESYGQVLMKVKEEVLEGLANQEVPFERIVEEVEVERDMSRSPLFQVMFVLQNTSDSDLQLPGIELQRIDINNSTTKFDLTLGVEEDGRRLSCWVEYNTDLFDRQTIRRMTDHYNSILSAIVNDVQQPVLDISLMSEAEQRLVLVEFNDTRADYEQNICLHELFEHQVERTPNAIGVVCQHQSLTYREINSRANQLARQLLGRGVGRESIVAICMSKGVEMVVSMLSVWKTGAAYVPIDPTYPQERIAYMLEDSGAMVILGDQLAVAALRHTATPIICLDEEWSVMAADSDQNPQCEVSADNLAYVIYTSGSTGQPKGAMNTHRGVVNRQLWMQQKYPLTEADRVLQLSSFSFDFSVWEVMGPLCVGASVVLPETDGHRDSRYIAELINEEAVSIVHFVPSMLTAFLEEESAKECKSLRKVFSGGEALSRDLVEEYYGQIGARLHNQYGPAEASIDVTYWDCERGQAGRAVAIGRPNANNRIHILDEWLNPVPVGVSGEIYIGGVAVGRGYLNRPDLTAERFIPDPYLETGGERLYRTGDLGKYRADGVIDYLGRVDGQVKLRGIRIEPGEVEAVLRQHEEVVEAAVVVSEDEAAGKILVGYVVTKQGGVTGRELRAYVRGRLPEYMVPAWMVELAQMPKTPSGKLDRRKLAEIRGEESSKEEAGDYVGIYEEMLGEIWAGVLGVKSVGRRSEFFELGGHSLLATKVASRVKEVLGVEMPVRTVFEHPVLREMARWIEGRKKERRGGEGRIGKVEREGGVRLSFAQQRMWFLDQLEPGSASYNIPAGVRLIGELDEEALERSINEVVSRHEALRTTFVEEEGEPRQRIHTEMKVELVREDLSQLEQEQREAELERRVKEEASTPFDLSRGPLLRAWLIRLSEQERVLVICMHHIISDGWSIGVMVREVSVFYEAAVSGREANLPALEVQYADYAQWQRDHLHGEVLERQLVYWKNQLAGASVLQLPTDRHRPPIQSYRGSTHPFLIPSHLADSLRSSSLANAVTLFMTLLSAFKVLLHRYSAQLDIIVGTPVAGRNRIELESLIGLFVNTLVLRTDFSDDPTFRQALGRLREASLESYAHDDLPFERLVEELQTERDLSRNPLFQVMFLFQHESGQQFDMSGVKAGLIPWHTGTAKFDLTLAIQDDGEQLRAEIEYNTDLYDGVTIQRMAGHFQKALAQLAEDADTKVSSIDLLSDSERFELIEQWNLTQVDYKSEQLLHKAFEAQVSRTPDKVAVIFDRERLTYRELDERANQLAHHLKQSGVGPDVFVGICAERSVEMVIGLLGILKAGGAYVPLDPEYPKERLAFIIEDAGLGLLLTQEHVTDCLPVCEAKRLRLDADWGEVSVQPTDPCVNEVKPDNLAYAIYTSGSTGRPKGVMISHRGISNRLLWMQDEYGLSETESVLQKTSFGFDVSVWEFFWPLMVGARLVMARPGGHKDPVYLVKEIMKRGITTLHFVPAMLQAFVDEPSSRLCESLKRVICSGEALSYELQEKFYSRLDAGLHNLYGPTEASVDVTYWKCEKEAARRAVPIGRPIANTQIYILDAGKQAVPVGVAGELYIGGVGLGRGYVNRPDLTGERFVPNPYEKATGSRLYATGDLARYQADGSIEYIGRLDHQVKIRGFRIELGEIEAVLAWHPQVRECLVTAHKDGSGETRLVAYLVGEGEGFPSASELREYVGEKLPAYMMPSAFLRLEEMPVTANGKVDRKALPPADNLSLKPEAVYVEPQNEAQRLIAEVMRDLLRVDKIGIHHNFFDVGAHSLLMVQAHARLREAFKKEFPLLKIFESPTVSSLARYLTEGEFETGAFQQGRSRGELRKVAGRRKPARGRSAVSEVAD